MSAYLENIKLDPEFPFIVYDNDDSAVICHHWHEMVEIVLVGQGELCLGVNHTEHSLQKDDVVIIGSGNIHHFPYSPGSQRWVFQFDLTMLQDVQPSISEKIELRNLFNKIERDSRLWSESAAKKLRELLHFIKNEFFEQKEGYRTAIRGALFMVLLLLQRDAPKKDINTSTSYLLKRDTNTTQFDKIFKYVEEHYEKDIGLKDAADEFGFDVFYFTKFFKKLTGITFGTFLTNYRVTKAQWYLLNDDSPVTEICYKAGFQSVKTFNRQFKNAVGISRTEYRKKTKSEKY